MATSSLPERTPASWIERWPLARLGAVLFLGLFVLFHANLSVVEEGDAVPSLVLPLSIVKYGTPTFDPERWPEMFKWRTLPPLRETDDFFFRHWSVKYGGQTVRELHDAGLVRFEGPRYYVVESTTRPGQYVSTFGVLPGLLALPVTAALHAIDHRLDERFVLRLSISKLYGALLIAGAATALFFAAARRTSRRRALLLALVYGTGTCAWAIASQNLWQQSVNQLLLALAACHFLASPMTVRRAAVAGFFFGAATACRSTSALFLLAAGLHVLAYHRRAAWSFAVGALPLTLLVALHNQYYFGSPLSFGQEIVGHQVAMEKTGSPELWQTPLHEGALGLLFSPGRGMMVYSPILGLTFWGMARIFRRAEFRAMRPLVIASLAIMALQCRWFDWWGGWAYGYRPWLDVVPYLTLFLLPVLDTVLAARWRRALFGGVLAWSVGVQALGALAYDRSWNLRLLYVVRVPGRLRAVGAFSEEEARALASRTGGHYVGHTLCNIDLRPCRHRLWLVHDSPIVYHLTRFSETRGRRKPDGWGELRSAEDAHESAVRAHAD
jgi:hypothetical protein